MPVLLVGMLLRRWMLNRAIPKDCGQMVTSVSAPYKVSPLLTRPQSHVQNGLYTQLLLESFICDLGLKEILIKARDMKVTKYEASCRRVLGQLGTMTWLQTG
jgi:hypothetical protein